MPARPTGRAARRAAGSFPIRTRARDDVVEAAHALGLNLRYVPSMRNGAERSDRGNAILSDLPLSDALGVRAAAGAAASSAARGDAAPRRRPAARRQRAPRPARAAGRRVARRGRAGEAGGTSGRPARRRPGRPRRGPQPRPRPPRARLAAAARSRSSRPAFPPRPRNGGTRFMRSGPAAAGAGLRAGPGSARARARQRTWCGSTSTRSIADPTVFGSDHHPLLARVALHPPGGTRS